MSTNIIIMSLPTWIELKYASVFSLEELNKLAINSNSLVLILILFYLLHLKILHSPLLHRPQT